MNINIRKQVVLAMETLARCVNDERIFEKWLALGVPDGDINSFDFKEVDEFLCENDNFRDLMSLFLDVMKDANKDGLYVDNIVAKGRKNES